MNTALGLLALTLGAHSVFTVDGSVREEIRAGTAVSLTGPNDVGYKEVLTPGLGGGWTDQQNRIFLLYNPEIQIPDLGTGNNVEVLQHLRLEYNWKERSGAQGFTIAEDVQYGIVDLFSLTPSISGVTPGSTLPPQPIVLQPIPVVTRLPFESSSSVVALHLIPSPKTSLNLNAGYNLNGGATRAARLELPLQQGPFGYGSLTVQATKNEFVETRLSYTDLYFEPGPHDMQFEATEGVTSRMGQHLVGTLGGGVSAVRSQLAPLPPVTRIYPEAQASVRDKLPLYGRTGIDLGISATMTPLIDRLGGNTFETLQILGNMEWAVLSGLNATALGGFTEPLYGNLAAAQRLELLQGALGYQPTKYFLLQAGVVYSWQQYVQGGAGSQWLAFVGFVLHDSKSSD